MVRVVQLKKKEDESNGSEMSQGKVSQINIVQRKLEEHQESQRKVHSKDDSDLLRPPHVAQSTSTIALASIKS